MGFFSRAKSVGGTIFNFRVDKWMGLQQLKSSSKDMIKMGQAIFTPEQADYEETFEEALRRLNLTEEQLQERRKEFMRLFIVYILLAIAIFSYSIYIAFAFKNIMGFIMGFGVTVFALVNAFRYHFWLYQIKHRKLGCTIREWFLDQN
ncbi:MAG TPA: type IVB secretion system protein IcmV [Gammaproteobacteria bacterium]|nr:type IVB secretion system protein IcmV [Gammaproteobacteria bacterium]